jgi:hypothetical protein
MPWLPDFVTAAELLANRPGDAARAVPSDPGPSTWPGESGAEFLATFVVPILDGTATMST